MLILNLLRTNPIIALIFVAGLIAAITVHECAHALVAYRLGDPTAKLQGRLTLNPLAHLDPVGTIALLLLGFGWGKPTPFDPYNLRNIKRDSALISVAGAASNFLLALLLSAPYLILHFTNQVTPQIAGFYSIISAAILVNVLLGIFNLIPIHPLDGFKVLAGLLPKSWYLDFMQMERYGIFILLLLLVTNTISKIILPLAAFVFGILLPGLNVAF